MLLLLVFPLIGFLMSYIYKKFGIPGTWIMFTIIFYDIASCTEPEVNESPTAPTEPEVNEIAPTEPEVNDDVAKEIIIFIFFTCLLFVLYPYSKTPVLGDFIFSLGETMTDVVPEVVEGPVVVPSHAVPVPCEFFSFVNVFPSEVPVVSHASVPMTEVPVPSEPVVSHASVPMTKVPVVSHAKSVMTKDPLFPVYPKAVPEIPKAVPEIITAPETVPYPPGSFIDRTVPLRTVRVRPEPPLPIPFSPGTFNGTNRPLPEAIPLTFNPYSIPASCNFTGTKIFIGTFNGTFTFNQGIFTKTVSGTFNGTFVGSCVGRYSGFTGFNGTFNGTFNGLSGTFNGTFNGFSEAVPGLSEIIEKNK